MSFPDCKLLDIDQRTPEWHEARKGRLTASGFGAWLADKKKVQLTIPEIKTELTGLGIAFKASASKPELIVLLPDPEPFMDYLEGTKSARITAASKVLAEVAGFPDPAIYENDDIKRGIEMEPVAIQEFSRLTGLLVDPIGFAQSKHGLFGCSPDGLILSHGHGLEVKCPRASKLIQYHQHGCLPDEYRDQVHGSMAVTGAKVWHFFAYHEGLPSFHHITQRDSYTEDMLEGLKDFSGYLRATSQRMTKLAESQAEGGV